MCAFPKETHSMKKFTLILAATGLLALSACNKTPEAQNVIDAGDNAMTEIANTSDNLEATADNATNAVAAAGDNAVAAVSNAADNAVATVANAADNAAK
jgi:hypothetical protein